nr:hypothetical protein [Tanacetum cinerariifolium]
MMVRVYVKGLRGVEMQGSRPAHPALSPSPFGSKGIAKVYIDLLSEVESDEDVPRIDAGVQDEASQPQSSLVVHAGPNLKHIDLEATDVSTQLRPEQMDEGFTTTAYPNVQENLKLTVKE